MKYCDIYYEIFRNNISIISQYIMRFFTIYKSLNFLKIPYPLKKFFKLIYN